MKVQNSAQFSSLYVSAQHFAQAKIVSTALVKSAKAGNNALFSKKLAQCPVSWPFQGS